jgi:arylsulfatase A-like enzyme
VLAGCQHEVDHADLSPLGYAEILARPGRMQGECYPETIVDVEHFLAREQRDPFFLSFGVDEPHNDNLARPELRLHGHADRHSKTRFYDPAKLDCRYVAPPPHLPDLPEIRREMASIAVGAHIMDEYFGRVLWALHHFGYDDNTLVIVTTDHGLELPGGKTTLSDMGLGVMLMLRGPGGFVGGRVFDGMVSHLDLYPTLLDVVGEERLSWLEGDSLVPLMDGRAADGSLHAEVFGEQTYHGGLEPLRCIRTDRHKFVLRHFPDGPRMVGNSASAKHLERHGWHRRPLGQVELFDLWLDPTEACNRATDPAYAGIRDDLERRLREWMTRTDDPFPGGNFPEPPGRR